MKKEKRWCVLNRRGEGYIDVAVSLLLILMVVLFALQIFSFLSLHSTLCSMTKEIAEAAAVRGSVDEKVMDLWEELCEDAGIDPTLSFEGTSFFSEKEKTVQYGERIHVSVNYESGIFGMNIKATASALSRVYHKGDAS